MGQVKNRVIEVTEQTWDLIEAGFTSNDDIPAVVAEVSRRLGYTSMVAEIVKSVFTEYHGVNDPKYSI